MYRHFFKRLLDIVIAFISLILLSPLIAVAALLTRVKLGKPIVFKQVRPGQNEKLFVMYKFRSMRNDRDSNGNLLPDSARLTKYGRWIRSSSIDETLELVNVLKGDMSIIGPRPLAVEYLPYYSEQERHRHDVRPGITGLAQVNGRNTLQWEEKFNYDLEYVKNVSFILDLKILFKTIAKVLRREDVIPLGEGIEMDFDEYRRKQYEELNDNKNGNWK